MWRQPAPAPAPADENEAMEEEQLDETNNNVNNNNNNNGGGGGGGGGGDGGGGGSNGNDDEVDEDDEDDGQWPPHAKAWFKRVKNDIDAKVKMTGRGVNRRPMGPFPDKYKGLISPSTDPVSHFAGETITMDHFALPDLIVWYPEAQYTSEICPFGRPKCKFHGEYSCCKSKGWVPLPRRGQRYGRNVAIIGRKFECTIRREQGKQCGFRNTDSKVIEMGHDYLKLVWRKLGFDLSRRAGISNRDLELSRRCLIQGLSVSGFSNVMEQEAKHRHLMTAAQYRSWVETLSPSVFQSQEEVCTMRRQAFYEFDSAEYSQTKSHTAYLISRLIPLMERDSEYKELKMQMIDGVHLSGDHSFKILKCCLTRGKPFTAIYCMLNEYSQVAAWWLTTGTGMNELEEPLRKLRQRYNLHGFDGPLSCTTDRCCQERAFWKRVLGPMNDDDAENTHLLTGDTDEIKVVDPPYNARCAYDTDVAGAFVGEISRVLRDEPIERQVILVDGEWLIGNSKMDVLIVGLLNGHVYLFHLAQICRRGAPIPLALKSLLEDINVKKVGNRIFHDVKKLEGWGVKLYPVVELGHLANDRCLSPTRAPSLAYLIDKLYPGVTIEGKTVSSESSVRKSNWNHSPLTQEQIHYANCDGYAPAVVYKRMMQIMNPKEEGKISQNEVTIGMKVILYLPGLKNRVAEGVIQGVHSTNNIVTVEIDLKHADCKSAIVHTVDDDGSIEEEGRSITSLYSNLGEDESSVVKISWKLVYCRRRRDPVGEDTLIRMNTRTKQVVMDDNDGEDDELHAQNYDEDNEANNGNDSSSSSDGENDNRTRLERSLRRRLHQFRKERVKNDIEHVFLRFQRVLSKEHGAYYSFITSLRDAFFVLNDEDLEECFEVLRDKRGMSDEMIAKSMAYDFKWYLRRVRRLVPSPNDLEKRYMTVYEAHKDIICQKSGKKLFETREAVAQHKSTLKHIRRNCLSDIPHVTYYTPLKRDKYGLMRWRCHRGTSQNEGLHQKLRQLVRGFSNSPRFLCAIISEYLLQWNQNIDVRVRGLPSKYDGLFDGVLLEDEIEKLTKSVDVHPHQDWVPTTSVQNTGEKFGIIHGVSTQTDADSDLDDAELMMMAEEAAEELSDDEADGGVEHVVAKMPASSQWLARLEGKYRPYEKVRGHDEWKYFEEHYVDYHGSGGGADNHTSINWSAFADGWNKMVDGLGRSKPSMTYKSASHLQHAYKTKLRRDRQAATLRPHTQRLNDLKVKHTNAANREQYATQFATPVAATTAQPFVDAMETEEQEGATYDADDEQAVEAPAASKRRKRKSSLHRCRKCGREHAHPDWARYHQVSTRDIGGRMLRDNSAKVWELCTVPEEHWLDGFPCLDTSQRMPPRK